MKTPTTGRELYNRISGYLVLNAKNTSTADEAMIAHLDNLLKMYPVPQSAIELCIRVYYNIEEYSPDGSPFQLVEQEIQELM